MEEDHCKRRPSWKMTTVEDDRHGKMSVMEDECNGR
jgi:hypothetical protein